MLATDERSQTGPDRHLKAGLGLTPPHDPVHRQRAGDALEHPLSHVLALKQASDQMICNSADHYAVGRRLLLQPGGNIGRLAYNRHVLGILSAAHLTGDYEAGMDTDTDVEMVG